MNRTEEALKAMLFAYSQAVNRKDVEAFVQLYDTAARVFDAWDIWVYDGRDAWRECVKAWFGAGDGAIDVRFDDVRMSTAVRFATVTAIATYAAIGADGSRMREMQNRITWVLRSVGDAWRIVHEHTSVPVDFSHSRAMLRRAASA